MNTKNEIFDELLDDALEKGEIIDFYGAEDEPDVELVSCTLWAVVAGIDVEGQSDFFTSEAEAREAFAEAKAEIEKEESEE
jgi:hypothetical protein